MRSALIGHTGFVGSNLNTQIAFDCRYNTKNIDNIQGKHYDILYCAGAPGTKWYANKNPEEDLNSINSLIENLKQVKIGKLVLLSTIGVYDNLDSVDEDYSINMNKLDSYGFHRRLLELFALNNFDSTIIRLPSIFGSGLKKNFIYDAIENKYDYAPNKSSVMQFYNLDNLSQDIAIGVKNNINILNISSEPINIGQLVSKVFSKDPDILPDSKLVDYNMRTKHSKYWGLKANYLYTNAEIVKDLLKFINIEKKIRSLT